MHTNTQKILLRWSMERLQQLTASNVAHQIHDTDGHERLRHGRAWGIDGPQEPSLQGSAARSRARVLRLRICPPVASN